MQTYNRNLPLNERIGGRYRIQAVLGEGGFGVTYRAWDERLERIVVLKEYLPIELGMRDSNSLRIVPLSQRENDYRFGLEKYLDEAKALAKFDHPNIVQILDHLEANGTAYIVMKFEEGETLAERLKRGNSTWNEAALLDLIKPILQGLQQVHQARLLHRDIKPGNIFLRKQGGPLLIDFGSARHALGEHSKSLSAIVSQGYAPPEQYSTRGKQGPYTDLYGLGAVLYELISGKTPVESIIRGHELMDGRPDPLIPALQAGKGKVPDGLLQLTDRLLAIPTGQRPQSCEEVMEIHFDNEDKRIFRRLAQQRKALTDPATIQLKPAIPKTRLVEEAERWGGPARTTQGTRIVEESQRFKKKTHPWPWVLLALVGFTSGAAYLANWTNTEPVARMERSEPREAAPAEAAPAPATALPKAPDSAALHPGYPTVPTPPAPPPVPLTGHLQINVNATGANIKLDGEGVGLASPGAPLKKEKINTGKHRVEVTAKGYELWQGDADIQGGKWTQLAVELRREVDAVPEPDSNTGARKNTETVSCFVFGGTQYCTQ